MSHDFPPDDLSDVPEADLVGMMLACGTSNHPTDKAHVKACRDELARRKPKPEEKP